MAFPPNGTSGPDTFVATNGMSLRSPYDTVDGGDGVDTILVRSGTTIADSGFAGLANFEVLALAGGSFSVTLGPLAAAAFTGGRIVVNAAAAAGLILDGSALTAATSLYVVGSGHGDSLTGGAGNDIFGFRDAAALGAATVQGGAGTDEVALFGNAALEDAAFAHLTGIERLGLFGTGAQSVTLGAAAGAAAGARLTVYAPLAASLDLDGSALGAGTALLAYGTAGADHMAGGAGADFLVGGANDTLAGGGGNDLFLFASGEALATATVDGGQGTDVLAVQGNTVTDAAFAHVSGVEMLALHGSGTVSATLGANAGAMAGASLSVLAPLAGALALDASGLGAGTALVAHGTAGADTITGGGGNDYIRGGGGADQLAGGGGNDTFVFADAAQLAAAAGVDGGTGANTIALLGGGGLTDAALAHAAHAGFLALYGGGAQAATLGANAAAMAGAALTVYAPGATSLHVDGSALGATALTVLGTAGDDTMGGGAGRDVLRGAGGNDTFVFGHNGGSVDVVTDFAAHGSVAGATIGFDDLAPGADLLPVPATYQGFSWSGVVVEDAIQRGREGTGFDFGTISPHNVALNESGGTATIASGSGFAFLGGAFTGGFNPVTVTVTGLLNGQVVATSSFGVSDQAPTHMTFGGAFGDVDTVQISAGGDFVAFDDLAFGTPGQGDTLDFAGYSQAEVQAMLAGAVEAGGSTYLVRDGGASVVGLAGVAKAALSLADFAWG